MVLAVLSGHDLSTTIKAGMNCLFLMTMLFSMEA